MEERRRASDEELGDLKHEIEHFKKEKDRVKAIVGQIGGIPTFNTTIFNVILFISVLICLVVSLLSGGVLRLIMIELAIAAVSIKLMYLIHNQSRVNHLQLWILSSIEWRINEIVKLLKEDIKK